MPPLWWYIWDPSDTESSGDETYNDAQGLTGTEINHLRLDRATLAYIAGYSSASAPADTIHVDANLHDQFRSYRRQREHMRVRDPHTNDMHLYVDMLWSYGRLAHDDDTSTCDDVSEHDTTSSSDNSEWEEDRSLVETFEGDHQDEHKHMTYDRKWERIVTMHEDVAEVNSSDRTQTHAEEETMR